MQPLVEEEAEEDDEKEHNETNELLRRELVTSSGAPLRAEDEHERGAAKTFPMWLGETRKLQVSARSEGYAAARHYALMFERLVLFRRSGFRLACSRERCSASA